MNVRRHGHRRFDLVELVRARSIDPELAAFLAASMRAGLTIIVSGATGSGKTTMAGALAAAIPPAERVVVCEEVFELRLDLPDVARLQCRPASLEGTGEVDLRRLVREALRMRPDRLVVGEVRGAEALDLLLAMNSGHPALCTLHANSARDAVRKLTLLPLLAGENVAERFVAATVASSIHLVVHLRRDPDGVRRVSEVVCLSGRVEATTVEVATVVEWTGSRWRFTGQRPPHAERFGARELELLSGGEVSRWG